MKRVVLVGITAYALLTGTADAAAPFRYDRELGDIARASLVNAVTDGRPFTRADVKRVYVRCYRDRETFERIFRARYGVPAGRVVAYYAGGPDLYMRNGTCNNVRTFLGGRHTVYTAGAYAILLHEALHRQGIGIERLTSCLANEAVRWGALRFGFDETRGLRARNLAFAFTRLFGPPYYRMSTPNCLALTSRSEWPDHVGADG